GKPSQDLQAEHQGKPALPIRLQSFPMVKRRIMLMQGDIILTLLAVFIALWLWAIKAEEPLTLQFIWAHVVWFFVLPLFWLALTYANDYYNLRTTSHFSRSFTRLAWVTAQLLLIYGIIFLLAPPGLLPRRFIFYYAVISLGLITFWRALRLFMNNWSSFRRRTLLVGAGESSEAI